MALDSNAQIGCSGSPLSPFIPFPTLGSHRVNVFAQDVASQENAYVFLPFILVGLLLRFLGKALFSFTIVVPKLSPLQYWWPLIQARASHFLGPILSSSAYLLAQLVKHRTAVRKVAGSNLYSTNTQGL